MTDYVYKKKWRERKQPIKLDAVSIYLRTIKGPRYKPLRTAEQHKALKSMERLRRKIKKLDSQELQRELNHKEIEFADHNIRLVVSVAKPYWSQKKGLKKEKDFEFQDVINQGNIGLLLAVQNYKTKFKTKFSTYATFWIKKYICGLFEERGKHYPKQFKIDTNKGVIIFPEGKEAELEDGTEFEISQDGFSPFGPANIFRDEEKRIQGQLVSELISNLPPKQKIMAEEIMKDTKGKDIAELLKNSPEAISQLTKRAVASMRKKITGDLWEKYRNTIKYRDKLFKLFNREDIEQEKRIKKILKQNKQKGREEYNKWVNAMPEKKRNAYCEIRSLNSLIQEYIEKIRKKIKDSWQDTGI